MTEQEAKVIEALVNAWNEFVKLPNEHSDDLLQFRLGVHDLQGQIMKRPTRREYNHTQA